MEQTQATTGAVAGYFAKRADAERALDALKDAGFTSAHLGVAHRGSYSGNTYDSTAGQKTDSTWDKVKEFFGGGVEPYADERSEGDLATREITDDGYGDSFHQNLNGLSVPEDRSRYLSHRFQTGDEGTVVTVNAGSRNGEAEEILTRYGADLGANAAGYDYSDTGKATDRQNIQLLGEILRVQKERVSLGDVRIRKEVVTENQTVQVPVSREELVIERRSVDGNTPVDGTIGKSDEIRIPLYEEKASVDKNTVVREEVSVGKRSVSDVRDLSSEVRHEELTVDDNTKDTVNR